MSKTTIRILVWSGIIAVIGVAAYLVYRKASKSDRREAPQGNMPVDKPMKR